MYLLHCMTVKFNAQIIYLSIYYIYFTKLFIILAHSDVTNSWTVTLNVQYH